jgi:GNAT superfamily N-acetyltransferase
MSAAENGLDGMRDGGRERGANETILRPDILRLNEQDESEFCRILFGLEPQARCSRFGHAVSNNYLANHAKCALGNATCMVGAFVNDRLRGVVEVRDAGIHAEAAFVVERDWRRRGIGWALLNSAMQIAAEVEANTLRMIFSRHNWPMRRLAGKTKGSLDLILDEISYDVALGQIGRRSSQKQPIGSELDCSGFRSSRKFNQAGGTQW